MIDYGLSARQLSILSEVLSGCVDRFESVGLFGSRATGRARPSSDIDLVVFGATDSRVADTLYTLFSESSLPMTVDVVDYDRIEQPALKRQIDADLQPLFTADELKERAGLPPQNNAGS